MEKVVKRKKQKSPPQDDTVQSETQKDVRKLPTRQNRGKRKVQLEDDDRDEEWTPSSRTKKQKGKAASQARANVRISNMVAKQTIKTREDAEALGLPSCSFSGGAFPLFKAGGEEYATAIIPSYVLK